MPAIHDSPVETGGVDIVAEGRWEQGYTYTWFWKVLESSGKFREVVEKSGKFWKVM